MPDSPHTNRLIHEKSPYLLQHAHNPVDWYPWGEEAFDLAKKMDKPIFLSIGYATCHWCHVMERESFENPEIAKLLNATFVNIKVDREELPEVDTIYMEFAQALMSSAGGWPLNMILTSDLKPFFAVTYLPPASRKGLIGINQFIQHIQQLWQGEDRHQLVAQADKIVEIFKESAKNAGEALPSAEILTSSVEMMYELTDTIYGGLKGDPKFPLGYQSLFLLSHAKSKSDGRALFCVDLTFDRMQRGGIYDQLGGGFSRYAVDEKWIVPHFEKMLYDNALLLRAYLEVWKFTKKQRFGEVAEEIADYLLKELFHPDGGFSSAQDADTNGDEGSYYTWTNLEIREVLSNEEAELFCQFYGVSHEGNFEGKNVLNATHSLEEFCDSNDIPIDEVGPLLFKARALLLKRRELRPRPFKDDKIITSWNGLAIDALAKASSALEDKSYFEAALKTAQFLKEKLWKEGLLLRRFRDGEARFNGGIDDYAFLIKGLLSLYEECGEVEWLEWAIELAKVLSAHFKIENGAFYYHLDNPVLLLRKCEFYDGAEPSGNAVHCENLLKLYQMTQDSSYLNEAEDILKAAKQYIEAYPPGAAYHLSAFQRYLDLKAPLIVVALDERRSLEQEIRKCLGQRYLPHASIIWKGMNDAKILKLIPSLVDKNPIDGQTAIYICRQDHCESPLIEKSAILSAIETL